MQRDYAAGRVHGWTEMKTSHDLPELGGWPLERPRPDAPGWWVTLDSRRSDENDGYFVSRLKRCANPVITGELREWRGRAIPLEGEQVFAVVDDPQREYIDVGVGVEFKRWELKIHELDEFDTSKEYVVEILLYTPLLSLLVSRE